MPTEIIRVNVAPKGWLEAFRHCVGTARIFKICETAWLRDEVCKAIADGEIELPAD